MRYLQKTVWDCCKNVDKHFENDSGNASKCSKFKFTINNVQKCSENVDKMTFVVKCRTMFKQDFR